MKTFEQILQETLYMKREEQWKHCIDYLEMFSGVKKDCILYNIEPCPMRCSYAMNKLNNTIK